MKLSIQVAILLATQSVCQAFVLPSSPSISSISSINSVSPIPTSLARKSKSNTELNIFSPSSAAAATTAAATSSNAIASSLSVNTSSLTQYFLETLISYGVPAFFWIVIIAFAAKSFKGAQKASARESSGPNGNLFGARANVVSELYNDLYGDSQSPGDKSNSPFGMFSSNSRNKPNPKNLGIPKTQFLKVTKLNDVYSSYKYSLIAATQSKAKAAAQFRSHAFDSALQRAFDSSILELNNAQKVDLLLEEKEFLNKGGEILESVTALQSALTELVIKGEMDTMDVEIGEVDAHDNSKSASTKDNAIDATIIDENKDTDANENTTAKDEKPKDKKKIASNNKKEINKLVKEIEKQNTDLLRLELDFIRAIIEVMGPDRANGIRSALLGNIAGGGAGVAGGLIKSLQDRPLSMMLETIGYSSTDANSEAKSRRSVFVTDFPGDVGASQVATLREEVTAIIKAAKPGDEALLVLQTGGGTVTGYGLAAAQLQRFKKHGMKLTICVEQVAASGGYMMTCVADKVIASPFAVLGSIGVISDLPNVYERLKQEGIEFQTITAGKYKRTLTPTKKVTKEDVDKQKEELEGILTLFKSFVKTNRPSLDIDLVATGETWFGEDALEMGLCDELNTVDDVLVDYVDEGHNVYQVRYDPNDGPVSPLSGLLPGARASTSNDVSANDAGIVQGAVRWLARNIIPTLKDEISKEFGVSGTANVASSTSQVQERYMFRDPSSASTNIKVQD